MKNKFYKIGRVNISVTNINEVIGQILHCLTEKRSEYICVANLRTVSFAHKNNDYRKVVHDAFLNIPDGMPLVWAGRLWGIKETQRVCGPDLLETLLKDTKFNLKHFFLGENSDILEQLQHKCSTKLNSNVVGVYSPPFVKDYHLFDYDYIADMINASDADVVWVALGAPKQDFFSSILIEKLQGKVVIGVGAAFRYILGEYKHPPVFFKKLALTGLWWKVKYHPFQSFVWYVKHMIILLYFFFIIVLNRTFRLNIYE